MAHAGHTAPDHGGPTRHTTIAVLAAVTVAVLAAALTGCDAASPATSSGRPAAKPYATAPHAGSTANGGLAAATAGQPAKAGGVASTAPRGDSVDRPGFAPAIDPADTPQSTFALDVDTASYQYAQGLIRAGQLPDPLAVRQEEFINSFAQDYPSPAGNGFSVNVDGSRMPSAFRGGDAANVRLLRIGLRTNADESGDRPDAALTFVIDVSGSMGDPGKLDLVKDALSTLVTQLHPTDSVAIVTFSSSARIVRRMTRVSERRDLLAAIDGLRIEGSTNLAAGLTKGYEVAREGFRPGATNRVVILSDGLANTGDTDPQRLIDQVREAAAKKITLLGVGVGNDYGDALMEKLVDNGDGFVVYVSDRDQARRVFVDRLPATASLRALDAKAQVTFDPATVASYRLVGYDDRALAASDFRNDHVDGGEVAAGFTVTALYVVTLEPGAYGQVAEARVRWLDPTTRAALEQAATVTVGDLDGSFAEASPRLQVCFVAGYFAEVLRGSPYGNDVRLSDLAVIAAGAGDRTEDPAVTDLAATIRRAADLR